MSEGYTIRDAAQERVAGSLTRMCALDVAIVDVTVEDLVGSLLK